MASRCEGRHKKVREVTSSAATVCSCRAVLWLAEDVRTPSREVGQPPWCSLQGSSADDEHLADAGLAPK
jgi:hypothetical protein